MQILLPFFATTLSLFHAGVVLIVAFGWWFEPLFYIHGPLLLLTLSSWLFTGSCILAVWEYHMRKRHDPNIEHYEHGYLHYHLRKLTKYSPSLGFIRIAGYTYLLPASILWINNLALTLGWYTY